MAASAITRILFVSVLIPCAATQSRLLVPQQYSTFGSAVAAAQDGDTIELGPGIHATEGLRITKGLHIVGNNAGFWGGPNGDPLVLATPAGKELSISGFGPNPPFPFVTVIELDQCQGRVMIADCASYGTIRIVDCAQVLLTRCNFNGWRTNFLERSPAHPAVQTVRSMVVLDHCRLVGPPADYETSTPANRAATFAGGDVRIVETSCRGGGPALELAGSVRMPGAGGVLATNVALRVTGAGSLIHAGASANEPALVVSSGSVILDPRLTPTYSLGAGATLAVEAWPTVQPFGLVAGQVGTLTLRAEAGALGALLVGFPADRTVLPGVAGDLWIDAAAMCVPAIGPTGGNVAWSVAVPSLWPRAVQVRWQGVAFDGATMKLADPGAAVFR